MSDYIWWFVDRVYYNRLTPSEGASACASGATVGGAGGANFLGAGAGCAAGIISDAITRLIMGNSYSQPNYDYIDGPMPFGYEFVPENNENSSCPVNEGSDSCPNPDPEFDDTTCGPPTCPPTCPCPSSDSSPNSDPEFASTFGSPTGQGSDAYPTVSGNDGINTFHN